VVCQLWSVQPALSIDNAKMLAHAFIASRVDYCNSILYQTAAVYLPPLQLVLNAAAHLRGCKEEDMRQYRTDHL